MVGQMGSMMRQVVGFGDLSTRRGTLGADVGHPIVTNGEFNVACSQIILSGLVESDVRLSMLLCS